MKVTKTLSWMLPYVESVGDLVPIRKIREIRSYYVAKNKVERQGAAATKYDGKYTIRIRRKKHVYKSKGKIFKFDKYEDIGKEMQLEYLAHELAHLIYWEHTPEHFELTTKIQLKFAKVLKKKG